MPPCPTASRYPPLGRATQRRDTGDLRVSEALPLPPTPTYRSTPRVYHPEEGKWEEKDRFGAGVSWELGRVPLSDSRGEASFLTRAPAKFFHSVCLLQQSGVSLPAPLDSTHSSPPAVPPPEQAHTGAESSEGMG